jgi:LmbE family N-acetylglucosaminyl deacetylase
MRFNRETAEVFVPDGLPVAEALARTTHMAIGAHQDDLEVMAFDGIMQCFQQAERWFCGVVMTDGSGSPRAGLYRNYSDEAMQAVRRKEQKKAAIIGEYGAQVLLDYPSSAVKQAGHQAPVEDIKAILLAAQPEVVYTHNLADKHDTHIGVAVKVIQAMRELPAETRPQHLYGCEVWRDLDWMLDPDKVVFDLSTHENLQAALLGVFDSQISGGKRYDLATLGRRRAHATYFASHETDVATGLSFAMDLTPLIEEPGSDIATFVAGLVQRFAQEVNDRLVNMQQEQS